MPAIFAVWPFKQYKRYPSIFQVICMISIYVYTYISESNMICSFVLFALARKKLLYVLTFYLKLVYFMTGIVKYRDVWQMYVVVIQQIVFYNVWIVNIKASKMHNLLANMNWMSFSFITYHTSIIFSFITLKTHEHIEQV